MNTKEITNRTIFEINWASRDRRSVKAYLAGKGDGRVLWWNINRMAHQLFRPKASLENIIYSFHRRHHVFTLLSLAYWADVQKVANVIQSRGIVAGIQSALVSSGDNPFF